MSGREIWAAPLLIAAAVISSLLALLCDVPAGWVWPARIGVSIPIWVIGLCLYRSCRSPVAHHSVEDPGQRRDIN